jgi:hypothetical protein
VSVVATTDREPANVADGPDAGAVKVTFTSDIGSPFVSFTRTTRGAPNAVLTAADWGVPETALMLAATGRGGPALQPKS